MVGNPPILRIPAQVGSTTLDALGNPLEYRGSAYPALPQKVQSVGRGFDGTTQGVQALGDYSNVGNVTVRIIYKPDSTTGAQFLFAIGDSHRRIYRDAGTLYYGVGNVIYEGLSSNTYYDIEVDSNSSGEATELRVNGVTVWTGIVTSLGASSGEINIGWRSNGRQFFSGEIAHLEVTGDTNLSIPFNNSGAYDLASDGTLVEYINNPSVVRQDVYHAEMDRGFYKAVRGDGAARINSGVPSNTVTSIKVRLILPKPPSSNKKLAGFSEIGVMQFYFIHLPDGSCGLIIGSTLSTTSTAYAGGEEVTLEGYSDGRFYVNDVLIDTVSDAFSTTDTGEIRVYGTYPNPTTLDHILLQAWVNGQEIDIHDTNLHIGTIYEHRLIDYP